MKRILIALAIIAVAFAATAAEENYVTTKDFKSKVFEVHNQKPSDLAGSLKLLGSGFQGAGLTVNNELRTITVRDFPENLATIEEALKRLDRPSAVAPEIEMKISILLGSRSAASGTPVPNDLAPVMDELRSALRYTSYALLTANVHRTATGRMVEGSGVIDTTTLGLPADGAKPGSWPSSYTYRLRELSLAKSGEKPSLAIEDFAFQLRFPMGAGSDIKYQSVGFNTPVTIRDGEKVVIGTTTMADRALIVVVTAKIGK